MGEFDLAIGGWHDHHIVRKVDGGSDALYNRVLLHPVCHIRLHALGLTVAKPAPQGASSPRKAKT